MINVANKDYDARNLCEHKGNTVDTVVQQMLSGVFGNIAEQIDLWGDLHDHLVEFRT